jgi:hypothetical protein
MRRRTAAFVGLAAVAGLASCGAHVTTAPAPKITLPPAQAAAGITPTTAGVTPTVAANPGALTPCSQLPFPGPVAEEDQLHDCWVVEPLGSSDLSRYEFFMGGRSPTDQYQGLLVFERPNAGGSRNVYSVPGRGGDVTVTLARWGFACYRTAGGTTGEFDAEAAAFVVNQVRVQTDCATAP